MFEHETKEEIFNQALLLISKYGYENVSMRDIAEAVGIRASSIYNHFPNKEQILGEFYRYYTAFMFQGRPTVESIRETISMGSMEEIVRGFTQVSFARREKHHAARMMLISKIIFTRMYHDASAAEIYRTQTLSDKEFIKEALDYGVEIGRFPPFETEACASSFVALYNQMGSMAFIQSEYEPGEPEEERKIFDWFYYLLEMIENRQDILSS